MCNRDFALCDMGAQPSLRLGLKSTIARIATLNKGSASQLVVIWMEFDGRPTALFRQRRVGARNELGKLP